MAEQEKLAEIDGGIDTGFWIDKDDLNLIKGPGDTGEYWIDDGYIWGPKNEGKYQVDEQGQILFGSDPTGFYIKEDKIFGPSKELPWKK